MRWLTVGILLLAGCAAPTPPEATTLAVVPGAASGHVLDWTDVRDLAPGGLVVERSLASAAESPSGVNQTELTEASAVTVQDWFTAVETFHPVRNPFVIRYEGDVYRVSLAR